MVGVGEDSGGRKKAFLSVVLEGLFSVWLGEEG